ncbi:hypothetical protein K3495_g4340 [Podosphaera aphanis]|nr:hypothetical protein K3495_g4340 [Podosphaera aphanis]
MIQDGRGASETPQTHLGDPTFLTNHNTEYEALNEQSLGSPLKDKYSFMNHMEDGGRGWHQTSTPRGRGPLDGRRNLPGLGAGEFTPMLKNATRNSTLQNGRDSTLLTPGFMKAGSMGVIPEDLSPLPTGSTIYDDSKFDTYMAGTPAHIDFNSNNSTPKALQFSRNKDGPEFSQDKRLSLREQESIIGKLSKENYGLKLRINFLEDTMQKASPDYNEAVLKENTELKVERVITLKALNRCRKSAKAAKLDLEAFRKQFTELQENVKQRQSKENRREEIFHLQQAIEEKEKELTRLKNELQQMNNVRDKVYELETSLEERNRHLNERDKVIENLKKEAEKRESKLLEYHTTVEKSRRQLLEVEEKAKENENLNVVIKRMENEINSLKEQREIAMEEKGRAEENLQELQEEMAEKSFHTKGFNRQIEEKAGRLQKNLDETREKCYALEKQLTGKTRESQKLSDSINKLKSDTQLQCQKQEKKINTLEKEKEYVVHERDSLTNSFESCKNELHRLREEKKNSLSRYDALTKELSSCQRDLRQSQNNIADLEEKLENEKVVALQNEQRIRDNYKSENDLLGVEIEHLKAQLQDRQQRHNNAYDKVVSENQDLQSQKELSDERAAGLQRIIDKLHEAEGSLSNKEATLQKALQSEMDRHREKEAALSRQIAELIRDVQARQQAFSSLKIDFTTLEEDLRMSQKENESLLEKIEGLEDEVEVLQTNLDDETEERARERIAGKQEMDNICHQLQSMKSELTIAESAASNAKAEIEKLRLDLQTGEGNNHRLNSCLEEAQQELSSLKNQLETAEEDLYSLKRDKAELESENKEILDQVQLLQGEIKAVNVRDISHGGSSAKRELATAKSQIMRLESRIHELEVRFADEDYGDDTHVEISTLRRDLKTARERDAEFSEREAKQKDIIRTLKRQISTLERKAHNAELSRFTIKSPQAGGDQSTLNEELLDLRAKLAGAHQSMKDLRSQLKNVEKDAHRKLTAINIEMETRTQTWETEKFELENSHHQSQLAKEVLEAKYHAAEQSIARLRSKVDRLQKALQASQRLHPDENRCFDLGRHDIYDLAAESHKENDAPDPLRSELATLSTAELDLRAKLKRLRDERAQLRAKVAACQDQLEHHQRHFRQAQDAWDLERRQLTHGVRFANVSSYLTDDAPLVTLQRDAEARNKLHAKEMRGALLQLDWLRAKCRREEGFRAEAAFAKRFMSLQISLFERCNQADIELLQKHGAKRPPPRPRRPVTIKRVGSVIRAIVRMRRAAQGWAETRKLEEKLKEQMSRQQKLQQQELAQRNLRVLAGSGKKMIEA